MLLYFLLLCLVVYSVNSQRSHSNKGFTCGKTRTGESYKCRNYRYCNPVYNMRDSGEHPKICFNNGVKTKVCCRKIFSDRQLKPVPSKPNQSEKLQMEPKKESQSISKKKCFEYQKYLFQEPEQETLALTPENYSENKNKERKCDISKVRKEVPLIWNGESTAPREFPHQVHIGFSYQRRTEWACGGSLISENFVLSAAHCSVTKLGKPRIAALGDLDTTSRKSNPNREEYKIIKVINHEKYKAGSAYNDIALYKLEKNVLFDGYKRPACLNTDSMITQKHVTASGLGVTKNGRASKQLKKARLKLIPSNECGLYWNSDRRLPKGFASDQMICASDLKLKKDACQGDSGGPLQILLNNPSCMYSIVGITSFGGIVCGEVPTVYTRVSFYVPWIESIVWPDERL